MVAILTPGNTPGAPRDAQYYLGTADSELENGIDLGALTTGILKHTVSGGESIPATAVEGTDYYGPSGTDVAVADGGTGASTSAGARTNLGAQEDLSGATISSATVATGDKVLIQDVDDSDNLKYVTAQSIADLAAGGGGMTLLETLTANNTSGVLAATTATYNATFTHLLVLLEDIVTASDSLLYLDLPSGSTATVRSMAFASADSSFNAAPVGRAPTTGTSITGGYTVQLIGDQIESTNVGLQAVIWLYGAGGSTLQTFAEFRTYYLSNATAVNKMETGLIPWAGASKIDFLGIRTANSDSPSTNIVSGKMHIYGVS